jgi:acetyltransferase-like isoleucine patch superfamily enzyme
MKQVIVFGNRLLCTMLYYDAAHHPDFEIAAFTVEREYLGERSELLGLPLVAFEDVATIYPPDRYDMIVIFTGYRRMRERAEKYHLAKDKGYELRNYFSPLADITPDLVLGDNNIIMSQSHIGFGGVMGSNNMARQQVYLGHEFQLGSHIEITAGCTIGGESVIGDSCYIGLGTTVINHIRIAPENLIGAGSVVIHDTEPYSKNIGNPSRVIGYHQEEGVKMDVHR